MSRVFEAKGDIKNALKKCDLAYQISFKKNRSSFMNPEYRKLSDRLVDLKVKALQAK